MTTIKKGKTKDVGSKFWEICDDTGTVIAKFNHNSFTHILSSAEVYFIDLNLDGLCENVQVAKDVDKEIRAATHSSGIETNAEVVLRNYVMQALLHALSKQGSARTKYLDKLRAKMDAILSGAASNGSKINFAILAANGVS